MIIPENDTKQQKSQPTARQSFFDMVSSFYGDQNQEGVNQVEASNKQPTNITPAPFDVQNNNPMRNTNGTVPGYDKYTGPVVGGGFNYEGRTPTVQEQQATTVAPRTTRKQARTSDEIMADIIGYKMPQITMDESRPEDLKRLARNNAIAKGLGLVADMIGLSQNATINRKQPDNMEAKYTQDLYNYIDQMNRRKDEYNFREYAQKLRNGEMMLQQANRNEAEDNSNYWKQKEMDRSDYWKKTEMERDNFWKKMQYGDKLADNELARNKAAIDAAYKGWTNDERERHNRAMEAASWLRANKTGTSQKEKFTIYNDAGKGIELDANEREKILTLILTDPNLERAKDKAGNEAWDNDIDLLKPSFGQPVSTNSMNLLVQKYWQKSPAVAAYFLNKGKLTGNESNNNTDNTTKTTTTDINKWKRK